MSLESIRTRDPVAAAAIARTLPLEGGYVDAAADPGGATNRGVSLRFALAEAKLDPETVRFFDVDHDGHITAKDIASLTLDQAADIYFATWWTSGWYGKLPAHDLAWKCFDIAVNTGPKRAALLLQKALCEAGSPVPVDASVGPATIAAAARQVKIDGGALLLSAIRREQADFYDGLVLKEASLKPFLKGWLSRAAA